MSNRTIMRRIFLQGLAAAQRDGDKEREANYRECLRRMKP